MRTGHRWRRDTAAWLLTMGVCTACVSPGTGTRVPVDDPPALPSVRAVEDLGTAEPPADLDAFVASLAERVGQEIDCRTSPWRYACPAGLVGEATAFEAPESAQGWPAIVVGLRTSQPMERAVQATTQVGWLWSDGGAELRHARLVSMTPEDRRAVDSSSASLGAALRGLFDRVGVNEGFDALLSDPRAMVNLPAEPAGDDGEAPVRSVFERSTPAPRTLWRKEGVVGADGGEAEGLAPLRAYTVSFRPAGAPPDAPETTKVHVLYEIFQGGALVYLAPVVPREVGAVEGS